MADPLTIITSIITLIDTAKRSYQRVHDAKHLPQMFQRIYARFDLATNTLFEVRQLYKNVPGQEEEEKVKGTLQGCCQDAEEIKDMYETVCSAADTDRLTRYRAYVSNMVHGRKGKVEGKWRSLLEGLQVLQGYHAFKNLSTAQEIAAAVKEISEFSKIEPSLLDDDGATFNAPVALAHIGNDNKAKVWQNNNYGPSHIHQGDHYHTHQTSEPPQTPPGSCHNMQFQRDKDFTNRREMSELENQMSREGARVAVVGMGGVGKSQLVIEYAFRFFDMSSDGSLRDQLSKHHRWILWIPANNSMRFEVSMRDAADMLRVPTREKSTTREIFQGIKTRLREATTVEWLVVLDSVDDATFLQDPPLQDYFPISNRGSVLITSRSHDEASKLVEHSNMVSVEAMTKSESVSLLAKKMNTGVHRDEIEELATSLEHIPLALTQAASYIRKMGRLYSVKQYIKRLGEALQQLEGWQEGVLAESEIDHRRDQKAQNSILATWHISFLHILEKRKSAADLLSLMSFCDRQGIPRELVGTMKLDGRTEMDEERFTMDFATLEEYSFVSLACAQMTEASSSPTISDHFEMHRLVQLATQHWLLERNEHESFLAQYVDRLYAMFPVVDQISKLMVSNVRRSSGDLFPHVLSVHGKRPQSEEQAKKWAKLMTRTARYLEHRFDLINALKFWKVSMEATMRYCGTESPETAENAMMMARSYRNSGESSLAAMIQNKAVRIIWQTAQEASTEMVHDIKELSLTLVVANGQYENVCDVAIYFELGELLSKCIGKTNTENALAMQGLARTLAMLSITGHPAAQAWLDVAEQLTYEIMNTLEEPDNLMAKNNLHFIRCLQGRNDEAEQCLEETLEILTRNAGRSTDEISNTWAEDAKEILPDPLGDLFASLGHMLTRDNDAANSLTRLWALMSNMAMEIRGDEAPVV